MGNQGSKCLKTQIKQRISPNTDAKIRHFATKPTISPDLAHEVAMIYQKKHTFTYLQHPPPLTETNKSPTKVQQKPQPLSVNKNVQCFQLLLPWTYHPGEPQRPCRRVTSFHAPLSTAPCRPPIVVVFTGPPVMDEHGVPWRKWCSFWRGQKIHRTMSIAESILFHFFEIRKSHRLKIAHFKKDIYVS